MPQRIHLLEFDQHMCEVLRLNLRMAGYAVFESPSAQKVHPRLVAGDAPCELLLLDWRTHDLDAIDFLRRLRGKDGAAAIPSMVLSYRQEEADKLLAFEAGADEFLMRPFSMREMLARVQSVLRRTARVAHDAWIEFEGLRLNIPERRVAVGVLELALPDAEFRLLRVLLSRPRHVHTRQRLVDEVWPDTLSITERGVDAAVARVRTALSRAGHYPCIQTIRSVGYRLVSREEALLDA